MVMCRVELFCSFKAQVDAGRWEVPTSTSVLKIENVKTLLPCVAEGNYICRYDRIYNY
jgi:hypothetical protein